jgi:hypothetical protein
MFTSIELDLEFDEIKNGRMVIDQAEAWVKEAPLSLVLPADTKLDSLKQLNRRTKQTEIACLGPRYIYGSHHFFAFIDSEAPSLSLTYTDPHFACGQLKWHFTHHVISGVTKAAMVPSLVYVKDLGLYGLDCHLLPQDVVDIGDAYFGTPLEPDNWGMWLLQGLPAARQYLDNGYDCSYLCWLRFDWQRELLKYIGIPSDRIVCQEPWRKYHSSGAIARRQSTSDIAPSHKDLELFRHIASEHPFVEGYEKIYLGRLHLRGKAHSYRHLEGEEELVRLLEQLGFKYVVPENLSFGDQVSVFRSARVIVGLGGAALFNTVFTPPGAIVVTIEGTTSFVDNHTSLFSKCGHHYAVVLGSKAPGVIDSVHGDWRVSNEDTIALIRDVI